MTSKKTAGRTRVEHDSMGELQVPAEALWGAQTQRAVQNFPISGRPMPRGFIRALGLVKGAAAEVNARRSPIARFRTKPGPASAPNPRRFPRRTCAGFMCGAPPGTNAAPPRTQA